MGISKGRQIVSEEELRLWQDDTWKFFSSNPELLEALQDKSRVFNLDETSIELGINKKKVLTQRGTKVLYNVSSSSQDHITTVLTVNAAGHIVSPQCFFRGKRNMAAAHLASLPSMAILENGASAQPLRDL